MEPYSARLVITRPEAKPEADSETSPSTAADTPFEARWVESDGQMSKPFALEPPLSRDDATDLRWYLERYHEFIGAGTRVRAGKVEAKIDGWGRALFDAAFGTVEGTNVYRNLLDAEKRGRPVLLTLGTAEPDVLVQPWELMRDTKGPLAFRGVSIRRQLEGAKPLEMMELRLPLRLLLIVSRPGDAGFIDPRTSVRPLLDGLDRLPKGSVEVEFCEPPTLDELEERISQARRKKQPFHIVHFDGHGTYMPRVGVGALCFEDDDRKNDLVTGQRLGDLLSRLEVPLVILEACRTSDLSEQPVFGSVAPALPQSGVGSVVAYSHSIHIEASRLLVQRFYRELADGMSVGQALSETRVLLRAKPHRWLKRGPNPPTVKLQDWFVPQLYQVGPDLSLVTDGLDLEKDTDSEPGAMLSTSWEARMHGFPPEPHYGFQGRAWELLELGRAFEKHNAVVLAGMGGMGKTALSREAAAWWLRIERFDEAVFCSFEHIRNVDRAVQILGQALEGLAFTQRPPEEQQAAAVALFRKRKMLLVWDNFESTLAHYQPKQQGGDSASSVLAFDGDQRAALHTFYRSLTDGQPKGRLLVTCRPEDTGLHRVKQSTLQGLARHDSLYLLTAIADQKGFELERQGYERPEIESLLDTLNDHPLSISLVAPHLAGLTPKEIQTDFAHHLDRFQNLDAEEGRNRSLHASLAFSTSRLSEDAHAVLPYLAWFQGGAFEAQIRAFTELDEEAWARVRAELESTALVRVETMPMFKTPFIHFHPTLPFAARASEVPDVDDAEQRFLAVYLSVSGETDRALRGEAAGAGMILMTHEEANFRSASERAFDRVERQAGWHMANTLQLYLGMAARRQERDTLAAWVRRQMPQNAALDQPTCASIRSHAEGLFAQGKLQEAVDTLQGLATRLENEGLANDADSASQLGLTYGILGQILVQARQPELAIQANWHAIEHFEKAPGEGARGNVAAALGDVANALSILGRYDEALEASEQGLKIDEELAQHRNAAVGHGQYAQILKSKGRYAEADARYQKALDLARQVGDLALQGAFLQHQGTLSRHRGDLSRSADLFEQAIGLFQQANDSGAEMQTYDLLASTEMLRGHLDAAEAWYGRSRELAEKLGDQTQLAVTAANTGILLQKRAEQTEAPSERVTLLRRAVASIEQSLTLHLERKNQVGAAASHFQIGVLHSMLGDLDRAENQLLEGLRISESLKLPAVYKDYNALAKVAEARGDDEAAAMWSAKRDATHAEARVRARGDGGGQVTLSEKAAHAFLGLAQAVHAVRTSEDEMPAEIVEMLAQLAGQSEPLGSAGVFLETFARGGSPTVPAGLPEPLPKILGGLLASLE